ncbi:uncharacterized protein V1510DRAFT_414845 [Dipodascopsis tothii]|uniref:uncharacterized protein n=1 Tax=Dipodascopsis tothii TaxID=44089 RepID=UPI0034CE5754
MASSVSLVKAWTQGDAFRPLIAPDYHLVAALVFLLSAFGLTILFSFTDRKGAAGFARQTALAVPAAAAFGFGLVYLLCAVGVYV